MAKKLAMRLVFQKKLQVTIPDDYEWMTFQDIGEDDICSIGELMFNAYKGTIDDDGDSLEDANKEIRETIVNNQYGPFYPWASFVIAEKESGKPVSATMMVNWTNKNLMAYCFTDPAHKRKGLGKIVAQLSANALMIGGMKSMSLAVTEGNDPAIKLYEKLGFEVFDPSSVVKKS